MSHIDAYTLADAADDYAADRAEDRADAWILAHTCERCEDIAPRLYDGLCWDCSERCACGGTPALDNEGLRVLDDDGHPVCWMCLIPTSSAVSGSEEAA